MIKVTTVVSIVILIIIIVAVIGALKYMSRNRVSIINQYRIHNMGIIYWLMILTLILAIVSIIVCIYSLVSDTIYGAVSTYITIVCTATIGISLMLVIGDVGDVIDKCEYSKVELYERKSTTRIN